MVESDGVVDIACNSQGGRILGKSILLVLFLLPFIHIGIIFSLVTHEVFGHGFSAILFGGTFEGIRIRWDGVGYAYSFLPTTASDAENILFMISGIIVNLVAGGLLFGLACVAKKISIRLICLIVSYCSLMSGLPYLLWNSLNPIPPGDVGIVMDTWQKAGLPYGDLFRFGIIIISGILYLGFSFVFFHLLVQNLRTALLGRNAFSPRVRFWMLLGCVIIPGCTAQFVFNSNWNEVAPGIGTLPVVTGVLSILVCAIIIYAFPPQPVSRVIGTGIGRLHVLVAWFLEGIVILSLIFWLQNGILISRSS
jgi:hypothetical protein